MLLAVGVEAVDAELDLGEDATGGIQLRVSCGRRYHLRNVEEDPAGGAVYGRMRASQTGEKWCFVCRIEYKIRSRSDRLAFED